MFKQTRLKLTWLNAVCYSLFLLLFLIVFYFSFKQMLDKIEQKIVEDYAVTHLPRFLNVFESPIKPPPSRFTVEDDKKGFYYVISKDLEVMYGEEQYTNFNEALAKKLKQSDSQYFEKFKFENESLLVMVTPIKAKQTILGYAAVGQNVTSYDLLLKNVLLILVSLLLVFSIGIALLSYYLAKRAMKPIQHAYDIQREFVANASHELRTPLAVISSTIELLDIDLKQDQLHKYEHTVDDLKCESQYMQQMLHQLLYLTRADQQQIQINMTEIDLAHIVVQQTRKFAKTIHHLKFKVDVPDEVRIEADKYLIEELLYILLKNASTYTHEGTITVTLINFEHEITLKVLDTGIGIPKEEIPYIFERFYRVDKVRNKSGTGLGLSIAKNIIEYHQGHVEVESQLHKGTTFTITLPHKSKQKKRKN